VRIPDGAGVADDVQVVLRLEELGDTAADHLVVVDEEDRRAGAVRSAHAASLPPSEAYGVRGPGEDLGLCRSGAALPSVGLAPALLQAHRSRTPEARMTSTAPIAPSAQRIVVGVDGSACAAQALAWALRQAVLTGASVDAVASWQPPAMISGAAGYGAYVDFSTFDLSGPTGEVLDKAVAAAVGDVPGAEAVTVRPQVLRRYAPLALLEVAEGADLLVVGSRGHSELSGLVLGSVSLHCVTHAHCPVVVVRSRTAGGASGD
jgi:nucleotide-binding universal stress UspA family protein